MARAATAAVRLLSGEREPVRIAVSTNVALVGLQTIQSLVLVAGDRLLLFGQTDATTNGIYTASAGNWFRASDARISRAINKGVSVHVQEGTYAGASYVFDTNDPNLGTSAISILPAMDSTSAPSFFPTPAIRTATERTGDRPHIRDWLGVKGNTDETDTAVIQAAINSLSSTQLSLDVAELNAVEILAQTLQLDRVHLIDAPLIGAGKGVGLTGPDGGMTTIVSRMNTDHAAIIWGPDDAVGNTSFYMSLKNILFQHRHATHDHSGPWVVVQNVTEFSGERLMQIDGGEGFTFRGLSSPHIRHLRSRVSFRDTPAAHDVAIRASAITTGSSYRIHDLDCDKKPSSLDYGADIGVRYQCCDGAEIFGLHVQNRNYGVVTEPSEADGDTISSITHTAAYIDRNYGDNIVYRGGAGVGNEDYRLFKWIGCRTRAAGRTTTGQGDPTKGRGIFFDVATGSALESFKWIGGDISQADFAGVQCLGAEDSLVNCQIDQAQLRENNVRNSASGGDLLLRGKWQVNTTSHYRGGALGDIITSQPASDVSIFFPDWSASTALKPTTGTFLKTIRLGRANGYRHLEFFITPVQTLNATPVEVFRYDMPVSRSVVMIAEVTAFYPDWSVAPQHYTGRFTATRPTTGAAVSGGIGIPIGTGDTDEPQAVVIEDVAGYGIALSRTSAAISVHVTGAAATTLNWRGKVTLQLSE